ncbi:hypothetical protein [Flavobacterium beibuense]|uniref:Membrane protein n=1 Tax=Flavobacterium beibuense TaxID=657326 RepID=A0A444WD26_9FLAO|nr:hypothetical protein [Flavobacterium beibuense]RYJ43727.1 Membrane protein [Flavobacterium beibuense]
MSTYDKYLNSYTKGFMGFNTIAILGQSCLGGIAAMFVLQNGTSVAQMVQLFLITIFCSGFNGAVLAQMKPKVVFNFLIATVVLNLTLALLNIFVI